MITILRLVAIVFLYSLCVSCKRGLSIKTWSYVNVRFYEDEYPIGMEEVTGEWKINDHVATLTANGYRHQRFWLTLAALQDTGYYPNPGINNIYFTDGLNFDPVSLNSGYIHISHLDQGMLKGNFQVSLHDEYNGSENRIIIGDFGINFH